MSKMPAIYIYRICQGKSQAFLSGRSWFRDFQSNFGIWSAGRLGLRKHQNSLYHSNFPQSRVTQHFFPGVPRPFVSLRFYSLIFNLQCYPSMIRGLNSSTALYLHSERFSSMAYTFAAWSVLCEHGTCPLNQHHFIRPEPCFSSIICAFKTIVTLIPLRVFSNIIRALPIMMYGP